MSDITVPVLIVGGGGAGLTASMLLSTYGIDSLLVSRYPTTSHLPKAHVLHQKTMEVYREVGVADAIYARGTPPEGLRFTAWYAGLSGDHDGYGREIGRLECWGHGYSDPNWVKASPCAQTNLPQIRLEPLLKARAEELGPGRLRFSHQLLSLEQDSAGVRALIEDRETGQQYTVRARYLLGCDGGRNVGKLIGIEMEGMQELASIVSIHMSADLSPWARDPDVLIRWLINPDVEDTLGAATLVPMGPDHWGPHSEEWVFHLNFLPGDPRARDDEFVLQRMRQILGLPNFEPKVHVISRWSIEGLLASQLRVGNVFLLGDAAHRHPPTGGLGLNTAVQDAFNLCWKIAAVLSGYASDRLLDTYEQERKPAGARAVQRSLENAMNHTVILINLGLSPQQTPQENWSRLRLLWSEGPEADEARMHCEAVIATQLMEFNEHNIEYGSNYVSDAIFPDGTPDPPPIDEMHVYQPSTRPGRPLPHAWLQRQGKRVALSELAGHGHFLLITGEDGDAWYHAATRIAQQRGLPLKAIRVSPFAGDWLDLRFDWLRQREIAADGAILVRPDHVVAWRSSGASARPQEVLEQVLDQLLEGSRGISDSI